MREVVITRRAEDDIDRAHAWWAQHRSLEQAHRWYVGLMELLISFEVSADRYVRAPENELFPYEVRQVNYGVSGKPTHRALFTIRPKEVVILRVLHLAQQAITDEDA